MTTNLFSTYFIGENRVAASILGVLRSLSFDRIQRVSGALLEESESKLVKVIVPARNAGAECRLYHAYLCQPDRPFQQVTRLAFYAHGHIHSLVPMILESDDHIDFVPNKHKDRLGRFVADRGMGLWHVLPRVVRASGNPTSILPAPSTMRALPASRTCKAAYPTVE